MKILIVNDYGTPTGGAEIQCLLLRDGLRLRGHDARFFATSAGSENIASSADYTCFGVRGRGERILQVANPSAYLGLRKVLAEFRPDVVHVVMFLSQLSPLILPLLRNVPSLYYIVSGDQPICPTGLKLLPNGELCREQAGIACYKNGCLPLNGWVYAMAQRKLWRRWQKSFAGVVTCSKAMQRQLAEAGVHATQVIWHGVKVRQLRAPLSSPPLAGFVGRLAREKGIEVLIRAFASVISKIPEARLIIAGDGPQREHLKNLLKELKISGSVSMLGHLSQSAMEKHLSTVWVQAVPSCWADSFPTVALEAMMRGTAVIGSDIGGLPESIRHNETGLLVQPGNVHALAAALVLLLENKELAERMGKTGHQVAIAHFSESVCVEKFIAVYESLCTT